MIYTFKFEMLEVRENEFSLRNLVVGYCAFAHLKLFSDNVPYTLQLSHLHSGGRDPTCESAAPTVSGVTRGVIQGGGFSEGCR